MRSVGHIRNLFSLIVTFVHPRGSISYITCSKNNVDSWSLLHTTGYKQLLHWSTKIILSQLLLCRGVQKRQKAEAFCWKSTCFTISNHQDGSEFKFGLLHKSRLPVYQSCCRRPAFKRSWDSSKMLFFFSDYILGKGKKISFISNLENVGVELPLWNMSLH